MSGGHPVVKTSWRTVSVDALTCFRKEFQVYFPFALLASGVAYLCIYLLQTIREKLVITRSYESAMEPERFMVPRLLFALGRTFVSSVEWWVVWLVFTFMLASVAIRLLQESKPTNATMGIGQAFRLVRSRRLGDLIGISALAGVATALFNIFLLPLLLRPLPLLLFQLHLLHDYLIVYDWATAAVTLIFFSLVAKMALAVPELVDDQSVTIGQAIRNSIMATAGWELFFLLEFSALGLAGGTLYFAGKDLLAGSWNNGQLTATGFELMLAAFTILLASIALALLAIVQSLVYLSLRYGAALALIKAENCEG
jgi:hypothetical protein